MVVPSADCSVDGTATELSFGTRLAECEKAADGGARAAAEVQVAKWALFRNEGGQCARGG